MARLNNLQVTAELFGVTRNTVSGWIRQGAPALEKANRANGQVWKLDAAAIADWAVERAAADAATQTSDKEGNISHAEADRRRAIAQAIVTEVEADDALKNVVSTSDAIELRDEFVGAIREQVMLIPARTAERIAAMKDPNQIRGLIEGEYNTAFLAAQAALTAKWAADPE
jgi:terminase small subunit / prophage DNA-packing protein